MIREKIIKQITELLVDEMDDTESLGLERYYDCDPEEYIKDPKQLESMSDDELLEMWQNLWAFQG
mgnify:FL=1